MFGSSSPFGESSSGFGASTSTPAFGTAAPAFGGSSVFGSTVAASPFGASSGSAFGSNFGTSGFGGAQQQPRVGSRVTPYAVTNDTDSGVGAQAGKFLCISAMPAYKDKQLEELRWEDYAAGDKGGPNPASAQPAAGGIFGQQQPAPAAASPFGSGSTAFGAAATPNPFGSTSTPNPFGAKPAFGSPSTPTPAFGQSSTPAFGTSTFGLSGSAFGGASAPAFGAASAPAFGQANSTPAFGSSPSPFGQSSGGAFGSSTFGASAPSLFGQSSPAFGAASTPAFGSGASTPAFGGQTSSAFGGGGLFGNSQAASSGGGLFGASTPGSQPFGASPAPSFGTNLFGNTSTPGSLFGQTKPAGLTQSSSSSLFSGFGPTPADQPPSVVSFPNLQTSQQGTNNIFGAAPPSFGQQNAFGLQQPTQNVVSVPSTPVTNPFGTHPAMPQITIGRSASCGLYKVLSRLSRMCIPSSSYYQFPLVFFLRSYSYKPLDIGRKEIRLIKLQEPTKSQPLCGNIIHVPLSAELRYWALSYCWGSLAGKRTIILDGKKLRITVNLDDALRQLGNSYGMLWVDAICINQKDIPERSREVLRMGEIYSLASGVAAWLGVASKTSDRAMDFLQVLETKAPRSQYDDYLKELPSENNLGKFVAEWTALKDLVKNGYWSRTWIIQELALCRRSKIVHCGTKSLPWDNFENVFGDSIFGNCILDAFGDLQELSKVSSSLQNLVLLSNFVCRQGLRDAYVCDLLCLTNSFLATDPRDKVYGMLALNADLRQLVPHPNYANSKGEVFRDLTKAMLASGYNLDLICLKHAAHVNRSDVVSWVPNWDVHGPGIKYPDSLFQALWGHHTRGAYFADAGKDTIISYVKDGSILRVRGISYDRVDGLGSIETSNSHRGPKEARWKRHDVVQPDHRQNAYGSDVDTFMALKQLSQEIFKATQHGYSLHNECLIPRMYRQIAFMDHNSTRTKMALEWLQQTEEFSFVGRSLQQWYEMAYTHGQALPLASSSSVVQMDPEFDDMLKCINRVAYDGWRWLSTDRGYLGQTHPQTQKGDEIVIVQGCTVPMVLRPCGQYYSVICAAFVQGIMNGEALQGVNDDQMRYFDLA